MASEPKTPEKPDDTPIPFSSNEEASRIYLLPNTMTAGNLFCGFIAVIFCIKANFAGDPEITKQFYLQAVWCILGAVVFDSLDGRLARLGGKESLFGAEFDSIADIVSFGMAPALLVYFLILSPESGYPFFEKIGWIIGFIYLLCAAVRLARFNVITSPLLPKHEKLAGHKDFLGLPVPAAAGLIASLVFLITNYELKTWSIILPFLMLLIAFLMVSSVRYPSFKKVGWQTTMKPRVFIGAIALIAAIINYHEVALALLFVAYIIGGLVLHFTQHKRPGNSV
ncbi:MAG: CDP-diacylglycerol--serine O-phosphatidyltransferase [Opitutales bacterium]|nr:CDP-diacylglycerol--serine O-phosphatidyltransferase [Opitutales bacterium]